MSITELGSASIDVEHYALLFHAVLEAGSTKALVCLTGDKTHGRCQFERRSANSSAIL